MAAIGPFFPGVVIGPGDIPRVDSSVAPDRQSVEMALLSLLAHWKGKSASRLARVTLEALLHLMGVEPGRATRYYEKLNSVIGDFMRDLVNTVTDDGIDVADTALGKLLIGLRESKGRVEGRADTLLRLLTKRFGPLAEDFAMRIRSARTEQLDRGVDAVLDARRLDDVMNAVGPA